MAYFYNISFFCVIILCLANIGHASAYNTTVWEETKSGNVTDESREYATTEKKNDCENGNCNSTQTPKINAVSTDDTRKSTPGATGGKPRHNVSGKQIKQDEESKSTESSGSRNSLARQGVALCVGAHCSRPPSTAVDIPDVAKVPPCNSSGRTAVVHVCLLVCIWIVHLFV
ncbi:uncharacterized protein LOC111873652 isoform X1 [Cryptotermes secundus]|uniref:uncharacterized protein LOC111873652 isoform X1 n=1 Tax=Cryptotermes secundus TaxID=105785 RepID=UPI000CD7CD08|nr:uncharacterized protein LOC111873652 isoform X1 [Cryptotermes secundus]